jgi:hypothetical protein
MSVSFEVGKMLYLVHSSVENAIQVNMIVAV